MPLAAEGKCSAKTATEMVASIRENAKCSNTVPTACACLTQFPAEVTTKSCTATLLFDATTWTTPNQCVDVTPDSDADGKKHTVQYPATYGLGCANTGKEPGSFACTKVGDGANHEFVMNSANYNSFYNSSDWCDDQFCFVDPCNCNKADMALSTWIGGQYYSYSQCGGADEFTAAGCSKTVKADCEGIAACKWTEYNDTDGAQGATLLQLIAPVAILLAFAQ